MQHKDNNSTTASLPSFAQENCAVVVSASEMQAIEKRMMARGIPEAALMEKVGVGLAKRMHHRITTTLKPHAQVANTTVNIGVLVGPGHNGADAMVVARELLALGYVITLFIAKSSQRQLWLAHFNYLQSLGVAVSDITSLVECDVLIDGLFGFGLNRPLADDLCKVIETINHWHKPVLAIDIPSGIHCDSAQVMGAALNVSHCYCLGLWKQAFIEDRLLKHCPSAELLGFDIPMADIANERNARAIDIVNLERVKAHWQSSKQQAQHKYQNGRALIIAGSTQYPGAAVLAVLGARASGVGMITLFAPHVVVQQVMNSAPETIIIGYDENDLEHALEQLAWDKYDAILCGPGLGVNTKRCMEVVRHSNRPLILDADAITHLAKDPQWSSQLPAQQPIVLTPHEGEYKRLFPQTDLQHQARLSTLQHNELQDNVTVILKGAKTLISQHKQTRVNWHSSQALAKGGSGDVLAGILVALMARDANQQPTMDICVTAVAVHAQAAIVAAEQHGERRVCASLVTEHIGQFSI